MIVDEREPAWVAKGDYGAPVQRALLTAGDVWVAADDDALVIVERKTWSDLLASIGDGRLFHQVGAMVEQSDWSYVVVTEPLEADRDGRVNGTGWRFSAVWGALLTVQAAGTAA
ncbi:MAG: ERCC4 domain-containing protein, partial [Planctomycetota bacterium]